jgi:tetratricopeptide (TPR) repeat protein
LENSSFPDLKSAEDRLQSGHILEAERLCKRFLDTSPGIANCHALLGKVYQAAGRIEEAQTEFIAALNLNPKMADAWLDWAILMVSCGHPKKAVECLTLALTHLAGSAHIHAYLSKIFLSLGNVDYACVHAERAVEISPMLTTALCSLGAVRKRQGRKEESIAAYQLAIVQNTGIAEAHFGLGEVVMERDRDLAKKLFIEAVKIRPDYSEALDGLGVCLFFEKRWEEALEAFNRALDLNPGLKRSKGHKTTILFLMGRLSEAWRLYRERFEVAGIKAHPHGRFSIPVWDGSSLKDKALLVWTELGLGEEIMQASMFNDAIKISTHLTVECSPRLEALFKRSFPKAEIIARINPTRPSTAQICADYQIAGGDLGGVFRKSREEFPRHAGYIVPDARLVEKYKKVYRGQENPYIVGLSWASPKSSHDKQKSLRLMDFAPLLQQRGVLFINLQYSHEPKEVETVQTTLGVKLITDACENDLGDIDVIAARIAAMDLIVSVSNTTAHIAGALNVPVWNIIASDCASGMWHWFSDSDSSAWYPSMRIYRRAKNEISDLMNELSFQLKMACKRHANRIHTRE